MNAFKFRAGNVGVAEPGEELVRLSLPYKKDRGPFKIKPNPNRPLVSWGHELVRASCLVPNLYYSSTSVIIRTQL